MNLIRYCRVAATPNPMEILMRVQTLARTLLTATALATAVFAGPAQAASHDSAFTGNQYGYLSQARDPFTDGARQFNTFTDGARKADPFTDGARVGKRDPFTDGAHTVASLSGHAVRTAHGPFGILPDCQMMLTSDIFSMPRSTIERRLPRV